MQQRSPVPRFSFKRNKVAYRYRKSTYFYEVRKRSTTFVIRAEYVKLLTKAGDSRRHREDELLEKMVEISQQMTKSDRVVRELSADEASRMLFDMILPGRR